MAFFMNSNRVWVHPLFSERSEFGEYCHLFHVLRRQPTKFFEYLRMSIGSEERLVVTAR
jgi:hypothetical protein